MKLSEPTPSILAVSTLISARRYVCGRPDGSADNLGRAMWLVLDGIGGKELDYALMLVKIDHEKASAAFSAVCASGW